MDEKAATRDRILEAAMNRIKHYGYSKTTMAEIAADCAMSPGNIYRFFEAKIDIAEAMARKYYADRFASLSSITRNKSPADRKLRELFEGRMRESYELFQASAKMLEVASVLSTERPLFMNELLAQERVLIAAVLDEGVATGVFSVENANFTAEMLQAATMKFSLPQMFSHLTMPKLEREFNGVMDMILDGLYAREAALVPASGRARAATEKADH